MNNAPILLFTYKRLDTLKQTVDALQKNALSASSDLFVFSDGAKNENDADLVNQVREYVQQVNGFKSITYFFSETNKGLASSIISGVSNVLKIHNSVIVLEDDLVVTPNFLDFMNKALDEYVSVSKVFSISGYSFDLSPSVKQTDDAYFLNRGWSWGWGTWKDRWDNVDWDVKDYHEFEKDPKLKRAFNKGGSDLSSMLQKQMTNNLDSWGIRWVYHQFKVKGLTLYPRFSKVLNIGFDSRATHTTGSGTRYIPKLDADLKEIFVFPQKIEAHEQYQRAFQFKMGIVLRIGSKLASIGKKLLKK
jgi:glycosyltransferase involved in cell wall biosynthesis